MAHIDDLVRGIPDPLLRSQLQGAVANLRKGKNFGLVFEEHIPETVLLPSAGIQPGTTVVRRSDPNDGRRYEVVSVARDQVTVADSKGKTATLARADVLVIKRFGEPIYPVLTAVGSLRRGGNKPTQIIINAENFHALQLLLFQHRGAVDCIYIDPPYNTGAKDWKYNNRYVDDKDTWRHSRWLSMMEKRLRLARELLRKDGVLIVTIGEHEVHHLGMLLEQSHLFGAYQRYLITIINAPQGNASANFSRVEEYAFFCVPQSGSDLIQGAPIDLMPDASELDFDPDSENELEDDNSPHGDHYLPAALAEHGVVSENARRRGNQSLRRDRPKMFFPIFIDEQNQTVVRAGPSIALDDEPSFCKDRWPAPNLAHR